MRSESTVTAAPARSQAPQRKTMQSARASRERVDADRTLAACCLHFLALCRTSRCMRQAFTRLRIARGATILYQHKPYGFLSPSSAPEGNKVFAVDLLTKENNSCGKWDRDDDPRDLPGLRAAGRLDADSTGLMVWSDDVSLVEAIIGQASTVEKEYLVRVSGHEMWTPLQVNETLQQLRGGMHLDGQPLRPLRVARINEQKLRMTLTEGKHRQIRRMCALVGLRVDAIKRVRIGNLLLKGLPVGQWVRLNPPQAVSLFQAAPWEARSQRRGSRPPPRKT